jgi:hypothetical protein
MFSSPPPPAGSLRGTSTFGGFACASRGSAKNVHVDRDALRRAMMAEQARRRTATRNQRLAQARNSHGGPADAGSWQVCDAAGGDDDDDDQASSSYAGLGASFLAAPNSSFATSMVQRSGMPFVEDNCGPHGWRPASVPAGVCLFDPSEGEGGCGGLGMVSGAALGYDLSDPTVVDELLRLEQEYLAEEEGQQQQQQAMDADDDLVPMEGCYYGAYDEYGGHANVAAELFAPVDEEEEACRMYAWHHAIDS